VLGEFTVYKRAGSATPSADGATNIICLNDLGTARTQPNLPRRAITTLFSAGLGPERFLLPGPVPFSDPRNENETIDKIVPDVIDIAILL
jgi:hypothetical protein